MTTEGIDPAQLRALRDLAQMRKDRDLAALSKAHGAVGGVEAELAGLDAAVAAAKAGVMAGPDAVSLSALDRYITVARAQREQLNTALARTRARAAEVQKQAVRTTGQVEVLEQLQALHAEETRAAAARRDLG